MIYCPKCGTANRDGSKFCNECGARLAVPGTGVACPGCGTFNPVTRLFCQKCGARLVSVAPEPKGEEPEGAPVTGFSLPTRLLEPGPGPEPEGPTAEPEGGLIPDWLADLEPSAPPEETLPAEEPEAVAPAPEEPSEKPEEAAPAEGAPDWLAQLRAGLGEGPEEEAASAEVPSEPEAAVPEAAPEGGMPDWLAQLRAGLGEGPEEEAAPAEVPSEPEAAVPEAAPEGGMPDWLAQLRAGLGEGPEEEAAPAEVPSEPEAAPEAAPEEEVPDWLAQLRATLPSLEEEEEEQASPPSWLEEEAEAYPHVPVFAEPVEAPEEESIPEKAPTPSAEITPEVPGEAEAGAWEIPPWLEGLDEEWEEPTAPPALQPGGREEAAPGPEVPSPPAAPEEPAAPAAEPEEEEEFLPDWLRVPVTPEPGVGETPEPVVAPPEEGEAVPGEIPPWLAPLSPAAGAPAAAEEGTGVLKGVSGLVPIAPRIAETEEEAEGPPPAPPVGASEANLFRRVLEEPPEEEAEAKPKRGKFPFWGRWLVSLVLLAAVGVPIVWGSVTGRPLWNTQPAVPPAAEALYREVEQVQPGDAVLVGWDVDPSSAGEMLPLAEAVLGHLMQRGARIFVVSQLPAGPPLAQQTLEGLARTQGTYEYGTHFLNLGYLPGDELGLRALSGAGGLASLDRDYVEGKALAQWDMAKGVRGVWDFRLIVLLAEDPGRVRRWIEQVGAQHDVPMVAAVGAAALPALQPYYETQPRQLRGLAGGTPGAAAYESLRGVYLAGQSSMEALTGGVLALVFIVVVGNVALLFGLGRG